MIGKRIRFDVTASDKEPLLDEHWVEIEGVETYAVSNYGRVMNVRTGRDLSVQTDREGHRRVCLYYKGKRYRVYIYKIVARAFFLNYKPGVGVGFQNGDKQDCSVLNLTLMKAVRR